MLQKKYSPFSFAMVPTNVILQWHLHIISLGRKHRFLCALSTPVMFFHTCCLLCLVSWRISWLIPVRDAMPDLWRGHHPGYMTVREAGRCECLRPQKNFSFSAYLFCLIKEKPSGDCPSVSSIVLIPAERTSAKSVTKAFTFLGICPNSFNFFPRIKVIITNYDGSKFYRYSRPKIKSSGVKLKIKDSFSSALLWARLWWPDDVSVLVYITIFLLRVWALIFHYKNTLLKIFSLGLFCRMYFIIW